MTCLCWMNSFWWWRAIRSTPDTQCGRFPDAKPDDGLVDVLLVRPASRTKLLAVLGKLSSGGHLDSPLVHVKRASRLSVTSVGYESPIVIDGEMVDYEPLHLMMLPQAIELLA